MRMRRTLAFLVFALCLLVVVVKSMAAHGVCEGRVRRRHRQPRPPDTGDRVPAPSNHKVASFTNSGGLSNIGNLEYQVTAASGNAVLGSPGTGNTGTLMGGALEQSNVDMASQLTDLIEAQTDYQADTKVVSTTQTVLQALVTNA